MCRVQASECERESGEDFYLYQRNYQKNIQISNDVGVENHIHILATLPKDKALLDYVRTIKANVSRWIKALDAHYSKFSCRSATVHSPSAHHTLKR